MEKEQDVSPEKLAECLVSFFKLLTTDNNINRFVMEIAQQTTQKFQSGQDAEISSKDIFLELFPHQDEKTASSTLANIWRKLPKLQNEISVRLAEHAVNEFGLNSYPWIEKIESTGGAGKLAKYKIIGIPINKSQLDGPNPYRHNIPHDIEYTAVQDYKPSWIAKLFFGQSNAIIGGKKWVMIFFPLIQMVFYLSVIALFIFAMQKETLATFSIYKLTLLIVAVWLFLEKKKRFERFTEDRIIIAPDLFMSWSELSLVQELVTVKDEKGNFLYKKVQLTKYAAICPICHAQAELAKGEPEFPRRIIGRCKESPREHVFSFDRVTKLGSFLGKMASKYL